MGGGIISFLLLLFLINKILIVKNMYTKILVVDDHIMITDFYKNALNYFDESIKVVAKNCLKTAHNYLVKYNNEFADLVILDLSMPSCSEINMYDGLDLAKYINVNFPETKIVIISGLLYTLKINEIIKTVNPNALIHKSDISSWDYFFNAIKDALNGMKFKSEFIQTCLKDFKNQNFNFDSLDNQIIILISNGSKTVDILNHLPLSLSAINKRKTKIKEEFNIENGNDEDIIREAKNHGLI